MAKDRQAKDDSQEKTPANDPNFPPFYRNELYPAFDASDITKQTLVALNERNEEAIKAWLQRSDPKVLSKKLSKLVYIYLNKKHAIEQHRNSHQGIDISRLQIDIDRLRYTINLIDKKHLGTLNNFIAMDKRGGRPLRANAQSLTSPTEVGVPSLSELRRNLDKINKKLAAFKGPSSPGPIKDVNLENCIAALRKLWGSSKMGASFGTAKGKDGVIEFVSAGPLFVQTIMRILDPHVTASRLTTILRVLGSKAIP